MKDMTVAQWEVVKGKVAKELGVKKNQICMCDSTEAPDEIDEKFSNFFLRFQVTYNKFVGTHLYQVAGSHWGTKTTEMVVLENTLYQTAQIIE